MNKSSFSCFTSIWQMERPITTEVHIRVYEDSVYVFKWEANN